MCDINLKSFLFFFNIHENQKSIYVQRIRRDDTSDTENIVVNGGRVMAPHARSIDVPKMSIVLRKSLCSRSRGYHRPYHFLSQILIYKAPWRCRMKNVHCWALYGASPCAPRIDHDFKGNRNKWRCTRIINEHWIKYHT